MKKIQKLDKFFSYEMVVIKEKITLEDFAKKYNLRKEQIIYESELLEKGDVVILTEINKTLHIVLPLETLSSIAKKYGVDEEYIKESNKIDKIFIGQQLYI